jgi:hypothetical protein
MPSEQRSRSRQSIHTIRANLATISWSAALLELEPDLTETGRIALKRIATSLQLASEELEKLGTAARMKDAPLYQLIRRSMA